jgi:hypothetical protein
MNQPRRRTIRGLLVSVVAAAALAMSAGSALGAHQLSQTGSPGPWTLPDTAANPAATCSYEGGGTAGSTYLTGIRLEDGPEITGTHVGLRSVGYRPLIQHRHGGAWVTVKQGTLITGQATNATPVALPGGLTAVPVTSDPTRFRLVLKLIWFRPNASVEGTRMVVVDQYVRFGDLGVGSSCKGRISTVN